MTKKLGFDATPIASAMTDDPNELRALLLSILGPQHQSLIDKIMHQRFKNQPNQRPQTAQTHPQSPRPSQQTQKPQQPSQRGPQAPNQRPQTAQTHPQQSPRGLKPAPKLQETPTPVVVVPVQQTEATPKPVLEKEQVTDSLDEKYGGKKQKTTQEKNIERKKKERGEKTSLRGLGTNSWPPVHAPFQRTTHLSQSRKKR